MYMSVGVVGFVSFFDSQIRFWNYSDCIFGPHRTGNVGLIITEFNLHITRLIHVKYSYIFINGSLEYIVDLFNGV